MKKILLLVMLSLFMINFACDGQNNLENSNELVELSTLEKDMLKHMIEEEKMARDVYGYLYEKYQIRIFGNIMQSEQTHMNRVLNLLDNYGIDNPASEEVGVFNDENLQELYDTLIDQGNQSITDALKVGATIEDVDIKDLMDFSEQTENTAILQVFSNLTCGSRNHMRAFTRNLSNYGMSYEPQYISQELYDEILENGQEQCGRRNW